MPVKNQLCLCFGATRKLSYSRKLNVVKKIEKDIIRLTQSWVAEEAKYCGLYEYIDNAITLSNPINRV